MIIGVLGLQGAFKEHINALSKLNIDSMLVKTVSDLDKVDGLIIPGGESTAMAILIEKSGLEVPLKSWISAKKPIWGTCAGMILLSNQGTNLKTDGQKLLGGLDVVVKRNAFGTQLDSFVANLIIDGISDPSTPFPAIFIRAPLIENIDESKVKVLASVERNGVKAVVAVQQGGILGTAFHPELTADPRIHLLFIDLVNEHLSSH